MTGTTSTEPFDNDITQHRWVPNRKTKWQFNIGIVESCNLTCPSRRVGNLRVVSLSGFIQEIYVQTNRKGEIELVKRNMAEVARGRWRSRRVARSQSDAHPSFKENSQSARILTLQSTPCRR